MITFRKLEKLIVGTAEGKPFNLPRTEDNIKALEELKVNDGSYKDVMKIVDGSYKTEVASTNKYLTFNPMTNEYFLTLDNKRSKHPIPEKLVEFIETSYDKDIDFMPVVKAWARLLANPRYNKAMGDYFEQYISTLYVDHEMKQKLMDEHEMSAEAATAAATYQDIAITSEGLLATYKVADLVTWMYEMVWDEEAGEAGEFIKKKKNRLAPKAPVLDPTTGEVVEEGGWEKPEFKEDLVFTPAIYKSGDKFFSNNKLGYEYIIGQIQSLPVNAKRNLKNTFGGGGLYSGGLGYIETYRNEGTHVLTCFVNPSDILSFQDEGQAFRTDALMPNNVWDEADSKLRGMYHSSTYAELSDARLEDLLAKSLERGWEDFAEEQGSLEYREGDLELTDDESAPVNPTTVTPKESK